MTIGFGSAGGRVLPAAPAATSGPGSSPASPVWRRSRLLIAFGFSALVGVVFGYFPARRAARLDPIEALRRE
jgi:ABC-type antimicrobial peptide transport system permease subunit